MNTSRVMLWVLAALLPGIAAMTYVWGLGVLWNVAILSLACMAVEVLAFLLRGTRSSAALIFQIRDYTALVTAWLIAICLPPFTPAAVLGLAAVAAIALGKHAYGGLGRNIFNPAMVGYAVVLVCFPQHLAAWPSLAEHTDALSGATILTDFRYRVGITTGEFDLLYAPVAAAHQLIALCFCLGGLLLTYLRVLAWRIPVAVFAAIAAGALFGFDQGSSTSLGSAWFHWTSGGFVAAAFFIATDPVTHPRLARHQIYYGLLIGALIYLIRAYGTFPDGIAFAVLLANCVTPLLNRMAVDKARRLSAGV